MKTYVIIFNRESTKSYGNFHKELTNSTIFNKWWHYIKTMYIVRSKYSGKEISTHVRNCLENHDLNKFHLVLSVNLADRWGWLTAEAWEWIQKNR